MKAVRDTPIRLPKPPLSPRPPRLPDLAPPGATPGRRSDTPSDMQMTKRLQRVGRGDPTPAPLPPSPGQRDAEQWFEQVPTNPAHAASLAESTGSHRRAQSSARVALPPKGGPQPLIERAWVLPTLIGAIALTIGLILGALLFGSQDQACAPCADVLQAPKQ